jgi:hypothetical protein
LRGADPTPACDEIAEPGADECPAEGAAAPCWGNCSRPPRKGLDAPLAGAGQS